MIVIVLVLVLVVDQTQRRQILVVGLRMLAKNRSVRCAKVALAAKVATTASDGHRA